jgi:hypothetical protein
MVSLYQRRVCTKFTLVLTQLFVPFISLYQWLFGAVSWFVLLVSPSGCYSPQVTDDRANDFLNFFCYLHCGSRSTFHRGQPRNHNGHSNWPYYTYRSCDKFATFANTSRIHNPLTLRENAFYSYPSYSLPRLQVAGKDKELQGHLYWVCATGKCNFLAWFGNDKLYVLDSVGIDLWKRAG